MNGFLIYVPAWQSGKLLTVETRTPSKICGIIIHWPLDIGFIWTAFISYLLSGSKDMSLDPSSVFAILINSWFG